MYRISEIPPSVGQYSADTAYSPQDRVYNNGSIFASLAEQTGNEPKLVVRDDGTYDASDGWVLVAVSDSAPAPVDPGEEERIDALEKNKMDKPLAAGTAGQHLALSDPETGATEWVDPETSEPVVVDDVLSYTSENPVQNKVVTQRIVSDEALIKTLTNEQKKTASLLEKETADRKTSDREQNERIGSLENGQSALSSNLNLLGGSLSNLRQHVDRDFYTKRDSDAITGKLSDLETDAKDSLVDAVNEVWVKKASDEALIKTLTNEQKKTASLLEKETADRKTSDREQNERIGSLENGQSALSSNLNLLGGSLSNLRQHVDRDFYTKRDSDAITGKLSDLETDAKDSLVDAVNEVWVKKASVDASPEKITHARLVELKNAGQLAAGQQYQITDYELTVNPESRIPMRSAGHAFDIIVTAISSEEISEAARATWHEGDDYFSDCRLEQWEIKYYIDAADKAYPLDFLPTNNGGKGVIYYMKDELGNEAPYDFKNMQYKRFKITSVLDGSSDTSVGNYLATLSSGYSGYKIECDADDYVWMYTFCRIEQIWSANVIIRTEYKDASIRGYGSYIDMNAVGNIIRPLGADRMYQWGSPYHYSPNNIVVIDRSTNNKFGYNCDNITLGSGNNDDNVFHDGCFYISILTGSARGEFNGYNITSTDNLFDCTVEHGSSGIVISGNAITVGHDSSGISAFGEDINIGSGCYYCTINGTSIRLGENCSDNTIEGENITIGKGCRNNTFNNDCSNFLVGDECDNNTTVEQTSNSIVFATSGQTIDEFELWYDNTKLDYNSYITPDALKTINGESIVGEGDIVISGGGTSDYTQLTNKPKIEGVELSGNKTASDLGLAKSSDLAAKQDVIADLADIRSNASAGATAYQKPSTGVPKTDLATDVQTSLTKADTALQEHQSLANYYTKSEVDNLIVSTINASF